VQKDTTVHPSLIEKELKSAKQWSKENCMPLNSKKTVLMYLSLTRKVDYTDVVLDAEELNTVVST
jgi:hypothetical protein